MYHGGCILFARHSFTAAPSILHKSPLRLCASVGSLACLRLAVPLSSFPHSSSFSLFPPRSHPASSGSQMLQSPQTLPNHRLQLETYSVYRQFSSRIQLFSSTPLPFPNNTRTHTHTDTQVRQSVFKSSCACFHRRVRFKLCVKARRRCCYRGVAPQEPHLSLLHVGLQAAELLQRRRGRRRRREGGGGGGGGRQGGSSDVALHFGRGPTSHRGP